MTKDGLNTGMKGFVMDLAGIRRNEQEKTIVKAGYEIAKLSFEMLSEEVKKNPFRDKYEINIYDDKMDRSDLKKIVELVTFDTDDINDKLNREIKVEGVRRISIG